MQKIFVESIRKYQDNFGLNLSDENINALVRYYELVQTWNPRLHLVAPCSAEEFAVRHILESLVLLEFLPENAAFADIGAGAGLPSIPCLIVRGDLRGLLIESNLKKTIFLKEVLARFNLKERADVLHQRFEEIKMLDADFATCRALDKLTKNLGELIRFSNDKRLLLFGGMSVRRELEKLNAQFEQKLIPKSEQRFLFLL